MLRRDINPTIGGKKADEVSKRDVITIIDAVADRGARYRSNRVLALVRSIYRWGLGEDLIEFDPTQGAAHEHFSDPANAFWPMMRHAFSGAISAKRR